MRTVVVLHTRHGRGSTWRYLEDWGHGVERNVLSATYERFVAVCSRLLASGRLPWGFGLRPRARFPAADTSGTAGYTIGRKRVVRS